jgi:hypothetical protein
MSCERLAFSTALCNELRSAAKSIADTLDSFDAVRFTSRERSAALEVTMRDLQALMRWITAVIEGFPHLA